MSQSPNVVPVRTLEDVHRDIALSNSYRQEFIKHMLSLAAVVFAFTVPFKKDLVGDASPQHPELAACETTGLRMVVNIGAASLLSFLKFGRYLNAYQAPFVGDKPTTDPDALAVPRAHAAASGRSRRARVLRALAP